MSAVLEIQKTAPKTEVFQNGQILDARLISVEEYDRMIEHGILTSEDKVELLNGVIIKKIPIRNKTRIGIRLRDKSILSFVWRQRDSQKSKSDLVE